MRERPWLLLLLSVSFLLLSAIPVLRLYHFYGLEFIEAQVPVEHLATELLGYLLIGVCGALLAWQASRSLLIVLPLMCVIASSEAFASFHYAESWLSSPPNFWVASLFLLLAPLWFVPEVGRLILKPSLCWWKTAPRVESNAPAHVRTGLGKSYVSRVLNISRQGMLLDIKTTTGHTPAFNEGQLLELRFLLGPLSVVHCQAEVVRKDSHQHSGRYGVRIVRIKSDYEQRIKKFVRASHSIGTQERVL